MKYKYFSGKAIRIFEYKPGLKAFVFFGSDSSYPGTYQDVIVANSKNEALRILKLNYGFNDVKSVKIKEVPWSNKKYFIPLDNYHTPIVGPGYYSHVNGVYFDIHYNPSQKYPIFDNNTGGVIA